MNADPLMQCTPLPILNGLMPSMSPFVLVKSHQENSHQQLSSADVNGPVMACYSFRTCAVAKSDCCKEVGRGYLLLTPTPSPTYMSFSSL